MYSGTPLEIKKDYSSSLYFTAHDEACENFLTDPAPCRKNPIKT